MSVFKRTSIYLLAGLLVFANFFIMSDLTFISKAEQDPSFMLYIEHPESLQYKDFYQNVSVEAGETYVASIDYYSTRGTGKYIRIMKTDWSTILAQEFMIDAGLGRLELEFTVPEDSSTVVFLMNSGSDTSKGYIWNLSVVKKGSTENLLKNADFSDDFTNWNGGSNYQEIYQILPFDDSLWNPTEPTSPQHMIYFEHPESLQYKDLYQNVSVEAGETYVASIDYYSTKGASKVIRIRNSSWSDTFAEASMGNDGLGHLELEFTVPEGNTSVVFMINSGTNSATGYIWNLSLVKKGTSKNLLKNADFSDGFTNWNGGSNYQEIYQILPFDDSLWNPKTDKDYMLLMKNPDPWTGQSAYKDFYQRVDTEANATYIFSFDYYAVGAENTQVSIRKNDWNTVIEKKVLSRYGLDSLSLEVTSDADQTLIFMKNSGTSGYMYIWNMSLKKVGSDQNLLVNGDFASGTLGGWNEGSTAYPIDTTVSQGTHYSVIEFDDSLWNRVDPITIPEYEGGTYVGKYNTDKCFTTVINNTNETQYNNYLTKLENNGYTKYSDNQIGDNLMAVYTNDSSIINVSYFKAWNRVFITSELKTPNSYLPQDSDTYTKICDPLLIQFKLLNVEQNSGMGYALRLSDGSFIMVDGGYPESNYSAADLAYNTLKEYQADDGKLRIAAWIFTHAHSDHIGLFNDFVEKYHEDIEIDFLAYNFPTYNDIAISDGPGVLNAFIGGLPRFYEIINQYLSDVPISTVHAGYEYHIRDAVLKVFYAPDNNFPKDIVEMESNGLSVIFQVEIAGQTIMFLGDSSTPESKNLEQVFGSSLKSDIMQMAHHGYNGATLGLYQYINPAVALWPCPIDNIEPNIKHDYNQYLINNPGTKEIICSAFGTRAISLPYTPPEGLTGLRKLTNNPNPPEEEEPIDTEPTEPTDTEPTEPTGTEPTEPTSTEPIEQNEDVKTGRSVGGYVLVFAFVGILSLAAVILTRKKSFIS